MRFSLLNIIILINSVIFALALLLLGSKGEITGREAILVFGTLDTFFVERGFVWLLVTANFLHFEIYHFVLNMFALFHYGKTVEYNYSDKVLFSTYVLGGVGASLMTLIGSAVLDERILSVGASGGIIALLGLLLAGTIRNNKQGEDLILRKQTLYFDLFLIIVISLLPQVNWLAHLGGFIVGFVMGYIFKDLFYNGNRELNLKIEKSLFVISVILVAAAYSFLILNLLFEIIKV
jgi:rhomboid protease GluP